MNHKAHGVKDSLAKSLCPLCHLCPLWVGEVENPQSAIRNPKSKEEGTK
ncbi:MAG: hypothetical protein QME81_07880 [bacterium]|nr:hypothetical protein [bacterium]